MLLIALLRLVNLDATVFVGNEAESILLLTCLPAVKLRAQPSQEGPALLIVPKLGRTLTKCYKS